ncbi:MAG: hypothetical protein JXR86_11650 [Spirochaetales bacterium]|nr:hypothetical protein [Spirochaetales bacterium]
MANYLSAVTGMRISEDLALRPCVVHDGWIDAISDEVLIAVEELFEVLEKIGEGLKR